MKNEYEPFKFRYEAFGGIIQMERPNALIYVDQEYMQELGYPESPLWRKYDGKDIAERTHLSAPTEVHLCLTNQCSAGCTHCYTDSAPLDSQLSRNELGREGMFKVLAKLAGMKVFHIALGGGESTELPWLFEVAHIARGLGMVPNLTTNGFNVNEQNVREFEIFGQVNVSIDGIGDRYGVHRGIQGFDQAERGLRLLRKAGVRVGINMVVSRHNFDDMESIFALGKKVGVHQLELLRYKPSGRAAAHSPDDFLEHDLDDAQAWEFLPTITQFAKRYKTPLAIDCSLTPYIYCHKPDPKKLNHLGVTGCYGGDMLCGVAADGAASGCSFSEGEGRSILNIEEWWDKEDTFVYYRHWTEMAPEPCRTCDYLNLCRGGCHVVAKHVHSDVFTPDPGCPLVRQH
ncbi:radical SAM protein, partial [bacterium]|nr:radical SAM protein [bacterium]